MDEEGLKKAPWNLDEPLLKPELLRDSLGRTYFGKFYGFDRLWILAFVVSAFMTPAARLLEDWHEGPNRTDKIVWVDTVLCLLGLLLMLSIVWAVDTPVFARMHAEHGAPPRAFWAHLIKALAAANLLRPLCPLAAGDSRFAPYSHVGGIFQASSAIMALPFGIGVYGMTMRGAQSIVKEIQGSQEEGKWVRVMQQLQRFRADMFCLWSCSSVGLPWCLLMAGILLGAYFNAVEFLTTRSPPRAIFFFLFILLMLAVLYPLAKVTSACSRQINSAAWKWYPPRDFGNNEMAMPTHVFQAYSLVLDFLDRKFIGVMLLGFPITMNMLRNFALQALVGLPSLYGAIRATAVKLQ